MNHTSTVRDTRSLLALVGGLALCLMAFPLLVLGSAAFMLIVFWPLFLGANLSYGYVPGEITRNTEVLGAEWWLLAAAWLALLVLAPFALRRVRTIARAQAVRPRDLTAARPRF